MVWVELGWGSKLTGSVPSHSVSFGWVLFQFGPVRPSPVRFGSVRFGSARFGSGLVRLDSVRLDSVRFGSVRRMIAWMNEKLIEERMLVEYMHGLMDEQRNEQWRANETNGWVSQ